MDLAGSRYKVLILGGGQLGYMMINEGRALPITFYVMDEKSAPACRIAEKCFSWEQYKEAVDSVDLVTYEFEHVDERALEYAHEQGKLFPGIEAVELKRERHKEKLYYKDHGLPTPRFEVVHSGEDALRVAREEFNNWAVIKRSRGGYDGKGQYFLKGSQEGLEFLRESRCTFVVEEYVDFDYEASVIFVRGRKEHANYPPTFNLNLKGILIYNYGPIADNGMVDIARRFAESLNYLGTMGMEFMVKGNKVYINEFAPRVHNTGHYTLDGALVSQFENHLRALLGLPLGSTEVRNFAGMVNLLGVSEVPEEVFKIGKVYWYSKEGVRRRRKVGHVNVLGDSLMEVKSKIDRLMELIYNNKVEEFV
ncbi:MAG: 5-(carboxyamino)imidazole ribonucleotide synthase [Sulfolobales archaeon]|nr:5-(carboxyamino)imidazole ribonucleotide synthase [Sulfolobales archaeon]